MVMQVNFYGRKLIRLDCGLCLAKVRCKTTEHETNRQVYVSVITYIVPRSDEDLVTALHRRALLKVYLCGFNDNKRVQLLHV